MDEVVLKLLKLLEELKVTHGTNEGNASNAYDRNIVNPSEGTSEAEATSNSLSSSEKARVVEAFNIFNEMFFDYQKTQEPDKKNETLIGTIASREENTSNENQSPPTPEKGGGFMPFIIGLAALVPMIPVILGAIAGAVILGGALAWLVSKIKMEDIMWLGGIFIKIKDYFIENIPKWWKWIDESWGALKEMMGPAWKWIDESLVAVEEMFAAGLVWLDKSWSDTKDMLKAGWEWVKKSWADTEEMMGAGIDWASDAANFVVDKIKGLFKSMLDTFTSLADSVIDLFGNPFKKDNPKDKDLNYNNDFEKWAAERDKSMGNKPKTPTTLVQKAEAQSKLEKKLNPEMLKGFPPKKPTLNPIMLQPLPKQVTDEKATPQGSTKGPVEEVKSGGLLGGFDLSSMMGGMDMSSLGGFDISKLIDSISGGVGDLFGGLTVDSKNSPQTNTKDENTVGVEEKTYIEVVNIRNLANEMLKFFKSGDMSKNTSTPIVTPITNTMGGSSSSRSTVGDNRAGYASSPYALG